jgi:hypothetical protein
MFLRTVRSYKTHTQKMSFFIVTAVETSNPRSRTDQIFCICQALVISGSTMRQYISYT